MQSTIPALKKDQNMNIFTTKQFSGNNYRKSETGRPYGGSLYDTPSNDKIAIESDDVSKIKQSDFRKRYSSFLPNETTFGAQESQQRVNEFHKSFYAQKAKNFKEELKKSCYSKKFLVTYVNSKKFTDSNQIKFFPEDRLTTPKLTDEDIHTNGLEIEADLESNCNTERNYLESLEDRKFFTEPIRTDFNIDSDRVKMSPKKFTRTESKTDNLTRTETNPGDYNKLHRKRSLSLFMKKSDYNLKPLKPFLNHVASNAKDPNDKKKNDKKRLGGFFVSD